MKTEKKLRLMMYTGLCVTIVAVVLACLAMIFEFESDIGYYAHSAPFHTVAQVLAVMLLLFATVMAFSFKKNELCQIINYDSTAFRFFASMTACLSLLCAYVEFTNLIASLRASVVKASTGNVLSALALIFSVASFFVYINYCFGKNEKKSESRGLCGMLTVAYLIIHLMETHVLWTTQMNNPTKIALQIALIVLVFGLIYTYKCEFAVNKTSSRLRVLFMLICPVFVLTFSIPTIIAYYARIYADFKVLVDAIYLTSVCGFVLSSYMPMSKARPIAAAEWAAINAKKEAQAEASDDSADSNDQNNNESTEKEA